MRVKEVMTEHPVCCLPAAPLTRVAKLMVENACGAIPVVSSLGERTPVGMITDRDIAVRTVAQGRNPLEMIAGDILSAPIAAVDEDATLQECAELMQRHKVRRMVVLDARGWVSGIVTRSQIARHPPQGHRRTSKGGNGA
ncbi:MAG TPA: CBS domain-containing protein [Fibrobacteria bacterium]|nr:CBS domain-containing protein [Fibrobacteria bacterium]